MVHYKIIYFEARGAAEATRQVLVLAGQPFDDVRVSKDDWSARKGEMPFGQLPVLEVDGKQLGQSSAMTRYLAKQHGFAGKDAWEQAQVDSLADQYKDYLTEIRPFFTVYAGYAEGDKDALLKDVLVPATEKIFGFLSKFLKQSGTGFLVGNSVTWVDLLIAEQTSSYGNLTPEVLAKHPELVAHAEKVHAIPKIAKWRSERPVTKF